MLATRHRLPRTTERLSLAFAVILVLLIGILAYRAWRAFALRNEQVQITRQVIADTNGLLSSLKDAETGQRGFLLTGEERYLEPYREALTQTPILLKDLDDVTASRRPDQAQRVEKLKPLVRDKLEELNQTIQLRRNQGLAPALAIVRTDRGQTIMNEIRAICAEIQSVANRRLSTLAASENVSVNRLGLISSIGSAILLAFLFFASFTIERGIQRRDQLIKSP